MLSNLILASGSYGEIFAAEDLQSPEAKRHRVAVKFDAGLLQNNWQMKHSLLPDRYLACRDNHLMYEYQVYKSG